MTTTQGEHAQPALSYEQQRAIMEGERNASLAAFDHDSSLSRDGKRLYEVGFTNGWDRHAALVSALAASAGSEAVAQAEGVFEFWWADHMPNATQEEAWREWCYLLRPRAVTVTHPSPTEGAGWRPGQPITEAMHIAAVKVLRRASGLDGLPQRMLDAMIAAAPPASEAKGA